jgi:hypothetical protein
MKTMTSMMKGFSTMIPMITILADAGITQNSITADEQNHTATIKLTREMYNAMASLADGFMVDVSEMEAAIGETIPVSICFSDTGVSPYDYSVAIAIDGESSPSIIYWSEDKKYTKLVMPITSEAEAASVKVPAKDVAAAETEGNLTFTYDDVDKIMTMTIESTGYKSEMSLQEKGTGALFYCSTKSSYDSTEVIYRLEGYADDNGGYVVTTVVNGFSSITSKETFDADGNLKDGDTSYSDTYDQNIDTVGDLETNVGFTTTTTAADGEYLVMSSNTYTGGDAPSDTAEIVGYGMVFSGNLVIQDFGLSAYSVLKTSGTVYLYKLSDGYSFFSDTTAPKFDSNPTTVSYTL